MGIVGSRSFLYSSYSPVIDETLINKIKNGKRGNFSSLQGLWERFKNFLVGIKSQEFTTPLNVILMAGGAGSSLQQTDQTACREAMWKFNNLPRRVVNGYKGPMITMTTPPDHWNDAGNIIFTLVYRDLNGNEKKVELCKINRKKDKDIQKKRKQAFELAAESLTSAYCQPHELLQRCPDSFAHETEVYDLFEQLRSANTESECDDAFLSLKQLCLDSRIKFKARVKSMDQIGKVRQKSYWVVFSEPKQRPYLLKKGVTSFDWDNIPSNTRDFQDDLWLKLSEDTVEVTEEHSLTGSAYFYGNGVYLRS
ncbi:hypothetical protein D5018_05240 [Parashewanella curva]|uniref:Uncharacterized protein n=1 Tax=Parashewanella curva TaxID=2338552 RepID=A0A3L8Q1G6_9GAMM|nr:hypothetical protein [Parashewanella curva]RLV60678.1 hypothetical protein D5018_05240 [Parashewanella curva]